MSYLNIKKLEEELESCKKRVRELEFIKKNRVKFSTKAALSKEELRETFWTCVNCKKRSKLKNIEITHRYLYVEPFSCCAGDYHLLNSFKITCPNCNEDTSFHVDSEEFDNYCGIKKGFKKLKFYSTRDGWLDKPPVW